MKIVVVGSGLIGLTSAYFLRRRGYEVTVVDRQEGPGLETSFANGALLTPSMSDPWNTPGCWRVLLASLVRPGSPLQLRLKALPELASWGITFLRNSKPALFERNTLANLRLARYSLQAMEALRRDTGIEYGRGTRGALKFFRSTAALDRAAQASARLLSQGLRFRRLSTEETVVLEPALAPIAEQLAGSLHYTDDETGDAYQFCLGLAEQARALGVTFRYGTEISALEVRSGRVMALLAGEERFVADRYVVAAGSYSAPLLRRSGLDLPVRPAKGYSLTFDGLRAPVLGIPVIDDALHAAVVPLDGGIRVAGTAEFTGFDPRLRSDRIDNLTKLVQQVLPRAPLDPAAGKPWCGLRSISADGVPLIGPTPLENLLVNTGHGHLGWTMAAGSGQLLAHWISSEAAAIAAAPYDPRRFPLK